MYVGIHHLNGSTSGVNSHLRQCACTVAIHVYIHRMGLEVCERHVVGRKYLMEQCLICTDLDILFG